MDYGIYSVIDANINRALEGIRVAEDCFRFISRNSRISAVLKQIRHDIADASKSFPANILLGARNVEKDRQKFFNTQGEKDRKSVIDVVQSNLHRAMEAVRSIEELYKLVFPGSIDNPFQEIRFSLYSIEKDAVSTVSREAKRKYFNSSLYAILDSSFVINEAYPETAKRMIKGGASVIQLRMKKKSMRNILKTAREISLICKDNDVLFIVNDFPEIAYLSDAGGVHLGQDDLKIEDVRSILPPDMIVGISTHSVEEAEAEFKNEPDYIAIGPVFDTNSKNNEVLKGIDTDIINHVIIKSYIPVVGIGGLTPERIKALKWAGLSGFAVISYLYKDDKIEDNCKRIVSSI
ncbi:MAG: thiamine phosphate synthase [Spirochaetes bacterium]|nr:thiamine phosphate synthase [Spirochaetota bacterium]